MQSYPHIPKTDIRCRFWVCYNQKMRKAPFVPGEYYHIYNRTILNIPEFKENNNCNRLLQAFLLANSTKSGPAFEYLRNNSKPTSDVGSALLLNNALEIARSGEKLVDVLCYAIMPDHYHLLIREVKEKGITEFIRKSNISIAKYVNKIKERKGTIFEGLFKSKHIDSNEYLRHLSLYIHLNPLDFIAGKDWRKHKLENFNKHRNKLLDYRWSSLSFFLNNTPNDIISGYEIITNQFKNNDDYEFYLKSWTNDFIDNDLLLE